ncbi:TIM barrel protein [Micrococcales bacterium 31B]|nr:TIM barrel protein [Micrococcales bacterium 31B]
MLTLAANAEMLYLDLPFAERVCRIAAAGMQVEMWGFAGKDPAALRATGAEFSIISGFERGNFFESGDAQAFLDSCADGLRFAAEIDVPRLCVHGSPLHADGSPVADPLAATGRRWIRAYDTLGRLADLGERAGRVFVLENFNLRVDHPGTPFAGIEHTLTLVEAVDSPHLRLNLDLYHAGIDEGSLHGVIERCLPFIGEVQIADYPGRCEPGTGEVRWESIAARMREVGYAGVVGFEGYASRGGVEGSDAALAAFAGAFR